MSLPAFKKWLLQTGAANISQAYLIYDYFYKSRLIGDYWFDVAASRMRAGEPEEQVMEDYGYVRN